MDGGLDKLRPVSRRIAMVSVMVISQPVVSIFSVQPEAALYLAGFAVLAIATAIGARASLAVADRRRADRSREPVA